jgi:hypothetical protein
METDRKSKLESDRRSEIRSNGDRHSTAGKAAPAQNRIMEEPFATEHSQPKEDDFFHDFNNPEK